MDHRLKELENAGRLELGAGDRIILESARIYRGTLALKVGVAGSADRPIEVTADGPDPAIIEAGSGAAIVLDGVRHARISRMVLRGAGRNDGNVATGLDARGCIGLTIEDVEAEGFQKSGIGVTGSDEVRIYRCFAHDNGFAGIWVGGNESPDRYNRNLHVAECRADNNPGDPTDLRNHSGNGILVGCVRDALVERCEASANGWDMPRGGNGPVGIWGWCADRLTIQDCVSHHNRTSALGGDGGGFDFDGGVTNSILQRCLSWANAGPGYELYQYDTAPAWENNILRDCVSVNDGAHKGKGCVLLGAWENRTPMRGIIIEHNVFINEVGPALDLWGGIPGAFTHNVVVGTRGLLKGTLEGLRVADNCTWNPSTRSADPGGPAWGLVADPRLVLPASWDELPIHWDALKNLPWFRPLADSPCRSAGIGLSARP